MKRKVFSLLMTLCLVLSGAPAPALIGAGGADAAEAATWNNEASAGETVPGGSGEDAAGSLTENDVLLAKYMDETLKKRLEPQGDEPDRGQQGDASAGGQQAGEPQAGEPQATRSDHSKNMSEPSAKLYKALKACFEDVANGKRTDTKFTFSLSEDLGIECRAVASTEKKAADLAYAQLDPAPNAIVEAVLADCPYDQYWFDKEMGWMLSRSTSTVELEDGSFAVTIVEMTFMFSVAADYAGEGMFAVDKKKMSAVQKALDTISTTISRNRGLSDYNKLHAYKDRICALNTYNHDAAANHSKYSINPWQLIWVFDNDPSTNVVCEGYSKAFQYLCDLSDFQGDVSCSSVTGQLIYFGTGAHMWNIVHMDGLNFLVDVTNCDEGAMGEGDGLFMVMAVAGDVNSGYHVYGSGEGYSFTAAYQYDNSARRVFSEDELALCMSSFVDVRAKDYFLRPVLWAVENGITKGTGDITFSPGAACTRGQAVTFLWRANGSEKVTGVANPFKDVKKSDYYYDAVLWALKNDVTKGLTATSFGPDATCSRGQIVTFLWRAQGRPESGASVSFEDVAQDAFYYEPVKWAVEKGVTNGTSSDAFSPDAYCTRGQIVTFLYRALV